MGMAILKKSFVSRVARCSAVSTLIAFAAPAALGAVKAIYQFQPGTDGREPIGNLVADSAGNLYGVTVAGGASNAGTVFKLKPNGDESVLYSFEGGTDAGYPTSLAIDGAGNLYGVSTYNGAYNLGAVFKVTPDGQESILHSFQGNGDGELPSGKLLIDQNGNIYGTTQYGGDPKCQFYNQTCGTVFRIGPDGSEKILHSFELGTDGGVPYGGVIADDAGSLYGTTGYGGTSTQEDCADYGCGTVFELKPNGKVRILYSFQGGDDGYKPYGGLVADSHGNFYGTTIDGCTSTFGCVFKVAPDGTETVLHKFLEQSDGMWPQHDLILDEKDNLYGLTGYGGNGGCSQHWGCGVAFKLSSKGTETILHIFRGGIHGKRPFASLLMGNNDQMYGIASAGGACSQCGVVFSLDR